MTPHAAPADRPSRLMGRAIPDWTLVEDEISTLLSGQKVVRAPVPVDEMVKSRGLHIRFGRFPDDRSDVAGFTAPSDRTIWVNVDDEPKRQRFTIARELGHWILHRQVLEAHPRLRTIRMRRSPAACPTPLDAEADGFAERLLIPGRLLERYVRGVDIRPKTSALADMFCVSEDVIRSRMMAEYGYDS